MAKRCEMDAETAKTLFFEGASLILLDVPEGTEIGIDYNSWEVGPHFKGIKMIPAGLHFLFYSALSKTHREKAPRTGMFNFFKSRDIVVKRWSPATEDFVDEKLDEEGTERYRAGLQDLDRYLGPYPHGSLKKWESLTNHITEGLLERIQPPGGKISSVAEIVPQTFTAAKSDTREEMEGQSRNSPGTERLTGSMIQFTEIPKKRFPEGASPSVISKYSIDSSYVLECMTATMKDKLEILGELQFAFICFLVGQVYDAFEHWKVLLQLLCSCDESLGKSADVVDALIGVLHFQLKEVPEDFFVDIISRNNFLTTTLQIFFSNIESSSALEQKLVQKALTFRQHLTNHFNWDFETESDEFAPVVIET